MTAYWFILIVFLNGEERILKSVEKIPQAKCELIAKEFIRDNPGVVKSARCSLTQSPKGDV